LRILTPTHWWNLVICFKPIIAMLRNPPGSDSGAWTESDLRLTAAPRRPCEFSWRIEMSLSIPSWILCETLRRRSWGWK
jgi:hypothetical protein